MLYPQFVDKPVDSVCILGLINIINTMCIIPYIIEETDVCLRIFFGQSEKKHNKYLRCLWKNATVFP